MAINYFFKLIVGLTILLMVGSTSALTPVETHGNLTTKGGFLLDKNGKIVQLRGMSFYWSTPGWGGEKYYTAATVDALVDTWKCTVLRVAYDRNNGNDNNWAGCKVVVDEAIKKGVYVILDWHSHTADKQGDAAIAWFKTQATTYKNTPNVIFEPFNEPITSDGSTDGSLGVAQKTWASIKPYLKNVTKAIRGAGADNLIILGTPYYSQYVNVAASDQIKDDNGAIFKNVAYSFHFYAASHGTEAYYVKGGTTGGMEASFLSNALGSIPIFITEWGTTHSDGGQDGHNYIDETNTKWWFDKYVNGTYHFSWCNWSVSDFQTSSAFSGGSTAPNLSTSGSGAIVKKLLTTPTTDTYGMASDSGYTGPANDSVSTMPGTIPAVSYNRYYGANFDSATVPFSNWDNKTDVRTAKNKCVNVLSGIAGEWASYQINSQTATQNLVIRYLSAGTGTIDVYLDNTSIGKIDIKVSSTWLSVLVAAAVPAGKHTLKFNFVNATGGYSYEWIELTNSTTPVGVSPHQKGTFADAKMQIAKNGFTVTLPVSNGYTSYSLIGVDGRIVKSAAINSSISQINFSDLTGGMWLLKLEGRNGSKLYKAVVSGR